MYEDGITPAMRAWADIKEAHRTGRVVVARAIGIENKALNQKIGEEVLKLDFNGVYGYLPKSRVDSHKVRGLQNLLGRELEVAVDQVVMDPNATVGVFIGNRAKALEKKAARFWKEAQEGQIFDAFIRGVDPNTLFLLVEGVPVEISRFEVSHFYYDDLTEEFEIGETIPVKLTSIVRPDGEKKGKITVDSKSLTKNPWSEIHKYQVDGIYMGIITKIHLEHGLYVEMMDTPGLVARVNFPPYSGDKVFKVGESIRIRIGRIDAESRRIKGVAILPQKTSKRSRYGGGSYAAR
ncbi:hypothetical protein [Paenibacillus mucilaginosus]|uniref:hypothetical protein n=1 Tax=Paenibacillus mucilaginosus TaxID=61624 RepID=UPI003D19EB8C